jgi:acetyltransferase-like isoleucine patch superfamily enzyme
MDIGANTGINRKAKLDTNVYPEGIHIGDNCNILAEAVILSHDACRNLKTDTYIGSNTIVGIRSIVLPGIRIGCHVVVGAGSVVTKDVPDHCVVAGNPAKIIREGIVVEHNKIVEE